MGHSQLFRLLLQFSPGGYSGIWTLLNAINQRVIAVQSNSPGYYIRPRIILENNVVLQRKQWVFHIKSIPARLQSENQSEYFVRLYQWWSENKLPDEVFIRLTPPNNINNKSEIKWRIDDRKPQFFSIENFMSFGMLQEILERAGEQVLIEEMLPDPDNLLKIGDHKRVLEYLIHSYRQDESNR